MPRALRDGSHRFAFSRFSARRCLNRSESAASSLIYLHSPGALARVSASPVSFTRDSQRKISLLSPVNCKSLTSAVVLSTIDAFPPDSGSSKFYPESSVRCKFLPCAGNCSETCRRFRPTATNVFFSFFFFFFPMLRCHCRLEMHPRNEVSHV